MYTEAGVLRQKKRTECHRRVFFCNMWRESLKEMKCLEYLVVDGGKNIRVRLQEIGRYGVDLVRLDQGRYRNFGFHMRGVS